LPRALLLGLLLLPMLLPMLLLGACAPSLERFPVLPVATPPSGDIGVTFLGVSTLLIDDGDKRIMVDGFFTRPGKFKTLLGRIAPDEEVVMPALKKYGATSLDVVVTLHSHHDHAMDAPLVAERSKARLFGSYSTRMIMEGMKQPWPAFELIEPGKTYPFGAFRLTLFEAEHSKQLEWISAPGNLTKPLQTPAYFNNYLEGGAYALLVEHRGRRILVLGSAGLIKAEPERYKADLVFLAIGGHGRQDLKTRWEYWDNAVLDAGAKRVIPTHWDDFTRPLSEPLQPFPWPVEDVPAALDEMRIWGGAKIEVLLPPVATRFDPFVKLPAR